METNAKLTMHMQVGRIKNHKEMILKTEIKKETLGFQETPFDKQAQRLKHKTLYSMISL